MTRKRQILEQLSRNELLTIVEEHDFAVEDRRVAKQLLEVIATWKVDLTADLARIDYVVAHELAHLVRGDDCHGRAFWARLSEVMLDYDARRTALRRLGPWLEW